MKADHHLAQVTHLKKRFMLKIYESLCFEEQHKGNTYHGFASSAEIKKTRGSGTVST